MLPLGLWLGGPANAATYLIVSGNRPLPSNLAAQVASAGGTLEVSYPFGVAVAEASDPDFPSLIDGVQFVVPDPGYMVESPMVQVAADAGYPPNSGNDDSLFDLQWGHNYVRAQDAWDAGATGAGVRVAVLDGGFYFDHPDLAPNINMGLSMDFTGEGLAYGLPGVGSHGTHVAGTIAAADNGFGTIGVAPEAELVLVKVLRDSGSGSFAHVIAGLYYAASIEADVINMSLGSLVPRNDEGPAQITQLAVAVNAAVSHAYRSGSTIIVAVGNEGRDLDGDGNQVHFMSGMSHVISVSSLTPLNWAIEPEQTLVPTSDTNYGTSAVDFSAPGGFLELRGNALCMVAGVEAPCWAFDGVFSTGNLGWYWSAGTSMAAAYVAGVAALIISENGGDLHPARVASKLRKRALDLCKAGRDDFYGHGLVQSGF